MGKIRNDLVYMVDRSLSDWFGPDDTEEGDNIATQIVDEILAAIRQLAGDYMPETEQFAQALIED